LILYSDSTFIDYSYRIENKRNWKNYKNYLPTKITGKIVKDESFYTLTEYINGEKSDIMRYIKIKNAKVLFYLKNPNGTFEKVYSMKRK